MGDDKLDAMVQAATDALTKWSGERDYHVILRAAGVPELLTDIDSLRATLAEKDRHLADARALIDQAETAFAGVAPYFTGDAERRSEGMALLRDALAALDQGGTANG